MPGSKRNVVEEAKDLKPRRVKLLRCTRANSSTVDRPAPYRRIGVRCGTRRGCEALCERGKRCSAT
jgi:hypothetical protein